MHSCTRRRCGSDTAVKQRKSENLSLNAQLYAAALRLDGPTLGNLELLENQENGECTGSLLARLDSCVSPGALLCHRPLRPKPLSPWALSMRRSLA